MKIINKLKKLIAHEQSARTIGNIEEANNFARRIQSLLDKHNLSMSEVELTVAQESPIDIEPVGENLEKIEPWQIALLKGIAQVNGCYALSHKKGFQVVVGRQIDRQITINLYQYFENLGRDLTAKYLKDRKIVYSGIYFELFQKIDSISNDELQRTSFLSGFVATVCQRLDETAKQNAAESENVMSLVFIGDKQKENQDWIEANLNIEKQDAKTDIDKTAFSHGASAGEEIALTDKTLNKG